MILCNVLVAGSTLPLLDRRVALTAGYCSGGRHNALLMAVLPASADADIFLFIAAVQFPIYMIPALLQPLRPSISSSPASATGPPGSWNASRWSCG